MNKNKELEMYKKIVDDILLFMDSRATLCKREEKDAKEKGDFLGEQIWKYAGIGTEVCLKESKRIIKKNFDETQKSK